MENLYFYVFIFFISFKSTVFDYRLPYRCIVNIIKSTQWLKSINSALILISIPKLFLNWRDLGNFSHVCVESSSLILSQDILCFSERKSCKNFPTGNAQCASNDSCEEYPRFYQKIWRKFLKTCAGQEWRFNDKKFQVFNWMLFF